MNQNDFGALNLIRKELKKLRGRKMNLKMGSKKLLAVALSALSIGSIGVHADGDDSLNPGLNTTANDAAQCPYGLGVRQELVNYDDNYLNTDVTDEFKSVLYTYRYRDECAAIDEFLKMLKRFFGEDFFIPEDIMYEIFMNFYNPLDLSNSSYFYNLEDRNIDAVDLFKSITLKKLLGLICYHCFVSRYNFSLAFLRVPIFHKASKHVMIKFPRLPADLIPKMSDRKISIGSFFGHPTAVPVTAADCNKLISYVSFLSQCREKLFSRIRPISFYYHDKPEFYFSDELFKDWLHSEKNLDFLNITKVLNDSLTQ